MLTVKEITNRVSLIGFFSSAIVFAGSTAFANNAMIAGLSGCSGTVSVYSLLKGKTEDDREQLKTELEKQTQALNSALTDARNLELDKSHFEGVSQRLQSDLDAMQTTLREMQALKVERDSLLGIQAKYEALQADYERLDKEQTQDNLDLEALKTKYEAVRTQLSNALRQSEALHSDVQRVTSENQTLLNENNQLKARFDSADELARLKAGQEVAQLKEAIAKLQQTYDQKMAEYVQLANTYNSLRIEDDAQISELKGKFAYLTGEGFQEVEQTFSAELSDRDRMLLSASAKIAQLEAPHYFDDIGDFVRPNRLIRALWESEDRLCLDASEIVPYPDNSGFDVYFSLRDRRVRGQATIDALNDRGNEFSVMCGCIKDLKFEYDRVNPHRIKAAFVLRKPEKIAPKSTVDKLWIPSEQFTKVYGLLKKPMTRIMGSTGEGKGIFVNLLLAIEANQTTASAVRLHDPMDGSSQDYWHVQKTSKGTSETRKAVKSFASEFESRIENKISEPKTLDVFDEIDIIADSDSSINKIFLNCAKGIRHVGMKAYIIGQSPSVGKKGFEWADMDNFNAVYFGTAIVTAIDKTPSLEVQSPKLKEVYQKLSDYCDKQNEELGLEGWNAYRFGLLVTGGKATFFELPNADSIPCDWSQLNQSLEPCKVGLVSEISSSTECSHASYNVRKTFRNDEGVAIKQYRKCKDCGVNFTVVL